jgi:hypothetical protein
MPSGHCLCASPFWTHCKCFCSPLTSPTSLAPPLLPPQVGRLVTVASLGSSACVLDSGDGALLSLSEDHRMSSNVRERQRLLAAGCLVAALDAAGTGPAPTPSRGSGVLRLWPGGLTLSRSLGDFPVGQGVLPLPHVKQVGSRLAAHGPWRSALQQPAGPSVFTSACRCCW